jgi:hypothetical protein
MISWKSKLKVLYKVLIVEFLLVVLVGYLSTLQSPGLLKSIEENFSLGLSLAMSFKLAIIFFSFNYKEKQGVLQQATFTMEQIFQIVFTDYYNRAVALDKKEVADAV